MKHNISLEFTAKAGEREFKEESITFRNPTELFQFVRPGGGCEKIADDVTEIQMVLLPYPDEISVGPMDDLPVTLEMGMVFLTGPMSDVVQVSQQLLGKAVRDELSPNFMKIIGL
ncbi:MAG: hypothetical protein OEY52_16985 [Gammaproteobacteria bacterium]|nr:hypothetical protein [Gammaproteobacteria bacterium]